MASARSADCPCGSGADFAACCGRYLDGGAAAPSAEALMRSRYTAYTLARDDYLLRTWHPSTRPPHLDLATTPRPKWLGLQVIRHLPDAEDLDRAAVEFVARYRIGGRGARMHETSRFVRECGAWYYIDGDVA